MKDNKNINLSGLEVFKQLADIRYLLKSTHNSGLSRVILDKNDGIFPFNVVNNKPNTIFVIQYDYTLGGDTVILPKNCILEFDGGSLNNGIIDGNGSTFNYNVGYNIFDNCTIKNFNIPHLDIRWFGAKPDVVYIDEKIISGTDNTQYIQRAVNNSTYFQHIPILIQGNYLMESTVTVKKYLNLKGTHCPHYINIEETIGSSDNPNMDAVDWNNVSKSSLVLADGTTAFVVNGTGNAYSVTGIDIDGIAIIGETDRRTATFLKVTALNAGRPNKITNCYGRFLGCFLDAETNDATGSIIGNIEIDNCYLSTSDRIIWGKGNMTFTNLSIHNCTIEGNGNWGDDIKYNLEEVYSAIDITGCYGPINIVNNIFENQAKSINLVFINQGSANIIDNYFEKDVAKIRNRVRDNKLEDITIKNDTPVPNSSSGAKSLAGVTYRMIANICRNTFADFYYIEGFKVNYIDRPYITTFKNCTIGKAIKVEDIVVENCNGVLFFEDYPSTFNKTPGSTILSHIIKNGNITESSRGYDYSLGECMDVIPKGRYVNGVTPLIQAGQKGIVLFRIKLDGTATQLSAAVYINSDDMTVSVNSTCNDFTVLIRDSAVSDPDGHVGNISVRCDDCQYKISDFIFYNDRLKGTDPDNAALIPTLADIPRVAIKSKNLDMPGVIDLCLPSGNLWCDHNIGATTPYEKGLYFSWGNVDGHLNDSDHKFNRDNYYGAEGTPAVIDPETNEEITPAVPAIPASPGSTIVGNVPVDDTYDACVHNMGTPWQLPSGEDFQELKNNCIWEWNDLFKVIKLTSKINGNSIFFPACGYYATYKTGDLTTYDGLQNENLCYYWSSTENNNDTTRGEYFFAANSGIVVADDPKFRGMPVRAIVKLNT